VASGGAALKAARNASATICLAASLSAAAALVVTLPCPLMLVTWPDWLTVGDRLQRHRIEQDVGSGVPVRFGQHLEFDRCCAVD